MKNLTETVNSPSYYNEGRIEVIDFIEDKKLGFHLGSAIKYICRAGKKNPEKEGEDLAKAVWYLLRYIGFQLPAKQQNFKMATDAFETVERSLKSLKGEFDFMKEYCTESLPDTGSQESDKR